MKNELAIEAIIKSPLIEQYLVGVTADSQRRKKGYKAVKFDCYVILETGLSRDVALAEERRLFELLTANKSKVLYKKYHHEKRDGKHHNSTGGRELGETYDLYIAWWNVI